MKIIGKGRLQIRFIITGLITLFFIFVFHINFSFADNITIGVCIEGLYKNYPLVKNPKYYDGITDINIANISKEWAPAIYLRGSASNQTDGIPALDKEKIQLNLEIEQMIYDGGLTGNRKKLENAYRYSRIKKIEIELYSLKEKVCKIYFETMLAEERITIYETTLSDLKSRYNSIESAVRNGVKLKNDLRQIKSEIINIEQDLISNQNRRKAMIEILNELTGLKINFSDKLEDPDMTVPVFNDFESNRRPENFFYESEKKKLEIAGDISEAKTRPKINAFIQAGRGKPGLNMFENSTDNYAVAGIKLNWKIYDWNLAGNEKSSNKLERKAIESQKEAFNKNIKNLLMELYYEIESLKKIIILDKENIELRSEILDVILSQYNNGVITATEYLINSNNLLNAKNLLKAHEIQLKYYIANFKIIRGDSL
ncbi:MAG TPA: TolC family protein [bacterium]|nr:TolC family protein [bacterium]HPN31394.1 TolC family protein [bacterium]